MYKTHQFSFLWNVSQKKCLASDKQNHSDIWGSCNSDEIKQETTKKFKSDEIKQETKKKYGTVWWHKTYCMA